MITIAEAVAQAAESKIGVRESGGANKGEALAPFFAADWYDPNGSLPGDDGYPWCAAFVCWCVLVAVAGRKISFQRPRTPSAWGLEDWSLAQDRSTWTLKFPGSDIKRGDIVVFRFSHVGIAVGSPDENGWVETVEGNTNAAGSREGDGVYKKRRKISTIRSRIRFR
jgi:cell wall-associated NlpC family hydrolase